MYMQQMLLKALSKKYPREYITVSHTFRHHGAMKESWDIYISAGIADNKFENLERLVNFVNLITNGEIELETNIETESECDPYKGSSLENPDAPSFMRHFRGD